MATKVALVTGATEGIGRSIATLLGRSGYAVGVTARTEAKVAALAAELNAAGIPAVGVPADVGNPAQVDRVIKTVSEGLGPIDVLVNNAGIAITKPLTETTLDDWDRTFATNVRSLYLLTHAVLPGMKTRGVGDIINVASLAGKNGVANAAAYSASKHAMMGFSRSLMLEVRQFGVRVITICPGSVDTPLMREQSAFKVNFDRILKAEDVAATVLAALQLPRRAMVSELEIRPSNP